MVESIEVQKLEEELRALREETEGLTKAALRIQSVQRGRKVRNERQRLESELKSFRKESMTAVTLDQKADRELEEAAKRIQAARRGAMARKRLAEDCAREARKTKIVGKETQRL